MITIIGWIGTMGVLTSYAMMHKHGPRFYDWSNAILFIPVALPALTKGVWSSAAIPISFGLIAIWKLVQK